MLPVPPPGAIPNTEAAEGTEEGKRQRKARIYSTTIDARNADYVAHSPDALVNREGVKDTEAGEAAEGPGSGRDEGRPGWEGPEAETAALCPGEAAIPGASLSRLPAPVWSRSGPDREGARIPGLSFSGPFLASLSADRGYDSSCLDAYIVYNSIYIYHAFPV